MTYGYRYWLDDPDAPFATLLDLLETYLEPEGPDYEGLQQLARDPASYNAEDTMRKFKEQLREALADTSQIPGEETLHSVAHFVEGNDERFLRRLWRDLYPGEPVPGGDDEFRDDLRQVIHGEVDRLPWTVYAYRFQYDASISDSGDAAFGRRIWQDLYPDEPVP